ncbi:MAG: L,D-transpeptidase [Acidimicrobiales bacterium]
MRRRRARAAGFAVLIGALGLAGCGSPAGSPGPATLTQPLPGAVGDSSGVDASAAAGASLVAQGQAAVLEVFGQPEATKPVHRLDNPQPSGAPLVLLVAEERSEWLRALLPVRPNGSQGWIRRGDVSLSRHEYAIRVELGAHRITVSHGEQVIMSEPIGLGRAATPTPGGRYYTKELIQPVDSAGRLDPGGPYGPYAYGLSGFSEVLYEFAGGDGVLGIHGTNDPSSVGRDSSAGCIRMRNEAITALAEILPLGVPVDVVA